MNKLGNKNYICALVKMDENNDYINEYILVYKDESYFKQYFGNIKHNLNTYIQSLVFMNDIAPIVVNRYYEIGNVIKIKNKPKQIPDDEYFPPIPIFIYDINIDYNSKPLIGLENIGATCYMNSTLQCLCNIKKFVEYFKYNKHLKELTTNDIDKQKLCSAFKLLIEKLYPYKLTKNYSNYLLKESNSKNSFQTDFYNKENSKTFYAPKNFKDVISRMNPLFEGVAANDAKDLVNFILMTLHEELNTAPKIKNNTNDNNSNIYQDQTNKALMFDNFINNFKNNYRSIISDLFYALNCNLTQCNYCQKISYNYQIYFFLIFPLEEVRKFILMNSQGFNNFNNNIVDIYDCFNYEQRITSMIGDNAMYCNYCKKTWSNSMRTFLTTGPEILIIILNRGKGIEFKIKINFYLELNLNNYIELQNTGTQYELFGVITHIGESSMSGHFIAYCKDLWNNQWLKFNDAIVSQVKDFRSEVIDFAMPYLLFYQKKH